MSTCPGCGGRGLKAPPKKAILDVGMGNKHWLCKVCGGSGQVAREQDDRPRTGDGRISILDPDLVRGRHFNPIEGLLDDLDSITDADVD